MTELSRQVFIQEKFCPSNCRNQKVLGTWVACTYSSNALKFHRLNGKSAFDKLATKKQSKGFLKQSLACMLNSVSLFLVHWLRHPFSLTSGPEDDYLRVHIRTAGDWSYQIYSLFQEVKTGWKMEGLNPKSQFGIVKMVGHFKHFPSEIFTGNIIRSWWLSEGTHWWTLWCCLSRPCQVWRRCSHRSRHRRYAFR